MSFASNDRLVRLFFIADDERLSSFYWPTRVRPFHPSVQTLTNRHPDRSIDRPTDRLSSHNLLDKLRLIKPSFPRRRWIRPFRVRSKFKDNFSSLIITSPPTFWSPPPFIRLLDDRGLLSNFGSTFALLPLFRSPTCTRNQVCSQLFCVRLPVHSSRGCYTSQDTTIARPPTARVRSVHRPLPASVARPSRAETSSLLCCRRKKTGCRRNRSRLE